MPALQKFHNLDLKPNPKPDSAIVTEQGPPPKHPVDPQTLGLQRRNTLKVWGLLFMSVPIK